MLSRVAVVILASLLLAAGLGCPCAVSASSYGVTVDGVAVYFSDQAPYEKDGRIMVPVRAPMEALGAVVAWDAANQAVTLTRNGITAVFTVGQTTYTVNGQVKTMDVAPEVVSERVAFPVRFCAEAMGATVDWNEATGTVQISSSQAAPDNASISNEENSAFRIQLLEKALAPTTADQAAQDWAQALKTRNGAWQYALLSEELRAEKLADFEMSWVTGFSSPWVTDYEVESVPAVASIDAGSAALPYYVLMDHFRS